VRREKKEKKLPLGEEAAPARAVNNLKHSKERRAGNKELKERRASPLGGIFLKISTSMRRPTEKSAKTGET